MDAKFSGTWKLSSVENTAEFYKSIGMNDKQLGMSLPLEDPSNNVTWSINMDGQSMKTTVCIGGKEIYTESYTLGQERVVSYEGQQGQMLTKLEGDVLVDILKKEGWIESRYERTVTSDKLSVVSIVKAPISQSLLSYIQVSELKTC